VGEELLGEGVYMTPTYGNTLMGLACSKPVTAEDGYKITYYAPPTPGYTTSLADIKVTWPAQVDPATGAPAGSVETFVAVNR